MKKIMSLAAAVIFIAACQKNSAPTPVTEQNSATLRSTDNAARITFVKIGTQKWMTTNLNVTHYRNGDRIPEVRSKTAWNKLTTGAWCWYNNDSATGAVYGRLYNWYAVNDPRGLAPEGWHVATNIEWRRLINFSGAGGALKETGLAHWANPNTGATNSTGFTALPGGLSNGGQFLDLFTFGLWWTSTSESVTYSYSYYIENSSATALTYVNPNINGLSVRCIKDKN